MWCVRHRNFDATEQLIQLGANINLQDTDGTAPLHVSVLFSDIEICKLMIKHGANPNLESFLWKTPLTIAMERGDVTMVNLLMDNGAVGYYYRVYIGF